MTAANTERSYLWVLLEEDRLKELLEALKDFSFAFEQQEQKDISVLTGKYARIDRQERLGVANREEINVERNKIRMALADILHEIPEEIDLSPERLQKHKILKRFSIISFSLYFLFIAALLWWLSQPVRSFRIEGQLWIDRVSFFHQDGIYLLNSNFNNKLSIYNYKEFSTIGQKVVLDKLFTSPYNPAYFIDANPIRITANNEISGLGITLNPVRIENLPIASGSAVTLISPKNNGDPLKIHIQNGRSNQIQLNYSDTLNVVAEHALVEADTFKKYLDSPTQLHFKTLKGTAEEAFCTTYDKELTSLDLFFEDSMSLTSKGLIISEPVFWEPIGKIAISSILGGKIEVKEVQSETLKTINLDAGEIINIIGGTQLFSKYLVVNKKGILLSFTGCVSDITLGMSHTLLNPIRLQWMWKNKKIHLFIGLSVAITLFYCFLIFMRKYN